MKGIQMARRVYLDHNATAPLLDAARDAMVAALGRPAGNPSSPHAFGGAARLDLESSRREVAALLGGDEHEIVFVSGGTEADNLAIQGSARAWTAAGRAPGHLIASAVEHPAVIESCRYLESTGWRLTLMPVDRAGRVAPSELRAALRSDTALVSIMAANNETGALQPIEELAEVCRAAGIPMHVDAVQAAGRLPLDVRRLGADMVSISAHKMGGPVGIGGLWVKGSRSVKPLLLGGGQEARRRPGTEPVALAAGFAAAVRSARERLADSSIQRLRDRMERELAGAIPGLVVNAAGATRLSNTSSLTLPGVDAEAMVIRMDLAGFAISTGSACSTGAARPSHVLAAMGLNRDQSASTIRVSLGQSTTSDDIETFVPALSAAAAALRGAGVGGKA